MKTGLVAEDERVNRLILRGQQMRKYGGEELALRHIREGRSLAEFDTAIFERQSASFRSGSDASIGLSPKEIAAYSISRLVMSQVRRDHSLAPFEREASAAVMKSSGMVPMGAFIPPEVTQRDLNATDVSSWTGGGRPMNLFTHAYRNQMRLVELGVTVIQATAGQGIPRAATASAASALTEIQAASESNPTTALITLTPHRVGGYIETTRQAALQVGPELDQMLNNEINKTVDVKVEDQCINGSGAGAELTGLRNVAGIGSVVGGTNGAQLSWTHLTDLEHACSVANADETPSAGYLVNSVTRRWAKRTQRGTGLPYIWNDNGDKPVNGYRAALSNYVPSNLTKGTSTTVCSSVLYSSDWGMAVLALFGAVDIVVDPITLASTGQIRIVCQKYIDFAIRQPAAFSKMDDALTA